MNKKDEYTVFLNCISMRNVDKDNKHTEIHFLPVDNDDDAKRGANELVRKLITWDHTYLRGIETIIAPDNRIIPIPS